MKRTEMTPEQVQSIERVGCVVMAVGFALLLFAQVYTIREELRERAIDRDVEQMLAHFDAACRGEVLE